jgi:hypothetical protein
MNRKIEDPLDETLRPYLDELRDVPPRDPHRAALGRAKFLTEAAQIREEAVSHGLLPRLKEWLRNLKQQKERYSMTTLISILTIFGLLFGGAGTAYAAQDSLPDDTLYAVKLWTEDVRLQLASSSDAEMDLLLQYAQRRVDEISEMIAEGEMPPEDVMLRLQEEVQEAIQLANDMNDTARIEALKQARETLQLQVQQLAEQQAEGAMEQARTQAQEAVQTGIQKAEEGIATAQAQQNAAQNQAQEMKQKATESAMTPEPSCDMPPCAEMTVTPPMGSGNGQQGQGNGGNGQGQGNGSMPTPGDWVPTSSMGGGH